MFQGFDENSSTQSSILYYLSDTANAGDSVKITDSSGKEIYLSSDTTQSFNTILFSSADLEEGKAYIVSVGSSSESVTLSGKSNTVGTRSQSMGQPPMNGGFQGNGEGQQGDRGQQGQPPMNGVFQGNSEGQGRGGQEQGNDQNRPPMPPMNGGDAQQGGHGQQGQPPMDGGNAQQGGRGQQGQPPMNRNKQQKKKNKAKSNNSSKENKTENKKH